jgi:DNA-directed RNA polymerase sigma subunit (sigma70/sigma32)
MTSIGFAILDNFRQCLESRKRLLYPRNAYILQRLYNWEEMSFPTEDELAKELKIPPARIRKIRQSTLKKLKKFTERNPTKDPIS